MQNKINYKMYTINVISSTNSAIMNMAPLPHPDILRQLTYYLL